MAIPSRIAHSGTFLVTSATFNRRRIFQVAATADLFVETLQHYRLEGHYLLHDFVVMPEHIHVLITPQKEALERVIGLVKGGFSHRMQSKIPVWQRGFTDRRVRDREEFFNFRKYIHENPVRSRLCEHPEEYKWSSAWKGWKPHEEPGASRLTPAAEAARPDTPLRHV